MANRVVSYFVAGITTTSTYCDGFVVEMYSDAGLTTLAAQATAVAVPDGSGNWVQKEAVILSGLSLGSTYWVRVGTVAPMTGVVTWSSATSVARSEVRPNNTYGFGSGLATQYPSGINFNGPCNGGSQPTAQFEAYWTLDGSTPANSALPMLTIPPRPGDYVNIFVGCKKNDSVKLFCRAISTARLNQAWVNVLTLTATGDSLDSIPNSGTRKAVASVDGSNLALIDLTSAHSGKNLDNIIDGSGPRRAIAWTKSYSSLSGTLAAGASTGGTDTITGAATGDIVLGFWTVGTVEPGLRVTGSISGTTLTTNVQNDAAVSASWTSATIVFIGIRP